MLAFGTIAVLLTLIAALVLQGMTARPAAPDLPGWMVALISVAIGLFLPALVAAFAVVLATIADAISPGAPSPNLGAGALIAAILGAPFVIWGTVLKYQTVRYQKEGHITDRISKAVEQLGAEKVVKAAGREHSAPNIEVRIGGLLSLERISQDSVKYDNGRDHVRVMEIICAYIRHNAPASGAEISMSERYEIETMSSGPDDPPISDEQFKEKYNIHPLDDLSDFTGPSALRQWARTLQKPREDTQLALSILGRRGREQRVCEARWGKDNQADTTWVFDTPPPRPVRTASDLLSNEEPTEFQADFLSWRRRIENYDGYRLDLRETNLQGADFSFGIFSGARLDHARLDGADLRDTRLVGARLWQAHLSGAILWSARLVGAELPFSRLEAAELLYTSLDGVDLKQATIEGVMLETTSLDMCQMTQEQLNSAFGSFDVVPPAHLQRPAHWLREDCQLESFRDEWLKWLANPESYTPPPTP
jgi:hypothetical protein